MATGKTMCVIPQYDRFHKVNREWRDACNDSGLWAIVLEVHVAISFPHGPWGTESWCKTLVDTGESYMETTGPEDLHFLDTDLFGVHSPVSNSLCAESCAGDVPDPHSEPASMPSTSKEGTQNEFGCQFLVGRVVPVGVRPVVA